MPGFRKVNRDKLFSKTVAKGLDFNFGKDTAEVFDDMLNRCIPMYGELQRMIGEVANHFALDETNVYDLGCSTGITLETLGRRIKSNRVNLIGVDYSKAMLDKCREKLKVAKLHKKFTLFHADLNEGFRITTASVVILNLTLQFIHPLNRDKLIKQIYKGLAKNGCLILVEKIVGEYPIFNRMFTKFYYQMKKRNGYSQKEISQKRRALEKVLIPYSMTENAELLRRNGFFQQDIFYKWHNFSAVVAVKA